MTIRTVQKSSGAFAQGELVCTFWWGADECALIAIDGQTVTGKLIPQHRRDELTEMTKPGDVIHDC